MSENGQSSPKKKLVNPYAVKKSKPDGFVPQNPINPNPKPPPMAAATFTQAFESLEDSKHYEQSKGTFKRDRDQLDQRAFEESVEITSPAIPGQELLSDRDNHAALEPHVLNVSTKQRGNNVLQFIRNVPYKFARMVPDYIFSSTRCALFLSLRYHSLHPNYIHRRISELGNDFSLRILLVLVDLEDNANVLLFLNKLAVLNNMSLLLVWSEEEGGRYLETLKAFESKDATLIQKKESTNFADQAADFLTAGGVNKTDAGQLLTQFGNVRSLTSASMDELGLVPGMGQVKVQKLFKALHQPFSTKAARERKRKHEEEQAQPDESVEETQEAEIP